MKHVVSKHHSNTWNQRQSSHTVKYSLKSKDRNYVTIFNQEIESVKWAKKNSKNLNNYHETKIHHIENEYSINKRFIKKLFVEIRNK
jgi:6-phosphofructokinase